MNIAAHTTPEPKRHEEPGRRPSPGRFPERHDPNPDGDDEQPARRPRRQRDGDTGRRPRENPSSPR
ncbi:MAG: hypothetical protein OJF55_002531 [Rhodanobacteraceae bacterium]|nr:MAG: hypothetical protein OJF55_002531 [Rhodanobacteraceae bacterium]